jgi:hypothetical protein
MDESAWAPRLLVHQCRSWQRGEPLPVEAFLGRHPGLASDPEALLDLIYNEVVLRELAGDAPRLAEYLRRFPHLAEQLRRQFEVHQALETGFLAEEASA